MLGAEPGPSNSKRWENINLGDSILGYSQKKFICYGKINYKLHNSRLAKVIWGSSAKGSTWEYINIFAELQYFEMSKDKFNKFFGYSDDFKPQGFSNINKILFTR